MRFQQNLLSFYKKLRPPSLKNKDISWINTYANKESMFIFKQFIAKYYTKDSKRRFWFGINPGRFGAGATGVAFNDPKILAEQHSIESSFAKKNELSAMFIDEFLCQFNTYNDFYDHNYITSVCPLGLIKSNKNYNYYDDKDTLAQVIPFIVKSIAQQVELGAERSMGISIGKGKNYDILTSLNKEHKWFEEIIAVPHPRWILQYKRKEKNLHIDTYLKVAYNGS